MYIRSFALSRLKFKNQNTLSYQKSVFNFSIRQPKNLTLFKIVTNSTEQSLLEICRYIRWSGNVSPFMELETISTPRVPVGRQVSETHTASFFSAAHRHFQLLSLSTCWLWKWWRRTAVIGKPRCFNESRPSTYQPNHNCVVHRRRFKWLWVVRISLCHRQTFVWSPVDRLGTRKHLLSIYVCKRNANDD